MFTVTQLPDFAAWHRGIKDRHTAGIITGRILRLEYGNFGNVKYFDGIGELKIDHGPGYRIYFCRRGNTLVVILCGGDKESQSRDIKRAVALAKEV